MTPPPDLSRLTEAQKDALILVLWQRVQELSAWVAELEAKLGEPPKTPDNSSVPPSQGRKANKAAGAERDGKKRGKGHGRGGRGLHPDPDQRVVAKAKLCPHCRTALAEEVQCKARQFARQVREERSVIRRSSMPTLSPAGSRKVIGPKRSSLGSACASPSRLPA